MKRPRSILHLISRLDGYGRARTLRWLAASQAAAGERVIVAALTAEASIVQDLHDQGVAVQTLHSRWSADAIAFGRLVRLRRQWAANVVHAWDVRSLALAAWSGRRASGQQVVGTLTALDEQGPWLRRLLRLLDRRALTFTVADEASRGRLAAGGVCQSPIHVIPPGVPGGRTTDATASSRSMLLELTALPATTKLLAVAGPLIRRCQLDEAIWTFELVRVLHPDARLIVAGDGPDRPRLERFAEQVSEPGCVQFLGYRDDWTTLLQGIDVFWQLNRSTDAPLALLEAAAAGVPTVASDIPAHRAATLPDRTGRLVRWGDRADAARTTDELFADPSLASRLGSAAAEYVAERWSLDATLTAFNRLYAGF